MKTSIAFTTLSLLLQSAVSLECGRYFIDNKDLSARIVGGSNAETAEFPWQVTIQRKSQGSSYGGEQWSHFCGGSIISESYILTAAHCVESMKYNYVPGTIRVVAGTTLWRVSGNDKSVQILEVARIIVHDGWNKEKGTDDVALLQLSTPIQLNTQQGRILVNKICLPSQDQEFTGDVVSSGWGYISKHARTPNEQLKKVQLPLIDHEKCRTAFATIIAVTPNQVCTDAISGQGNCMGDSGGPLVKPSDGTAIQVGIVSFSIPCAAGYPDVFTKVSRYVNWIQSNSGVSGSGSKSGSESGSESGSGAGVGAGTVPPPWDHGSGSESGSGAGVGAGTVLPPWDQGAGAGAGVGAGTVPPSWDQGSRPPGWPAPGEGSETHVWPKPGE